jgi:hypothetical protein
MTARNGAKSYARFKDSIDGDRDYAEKNGKSFNAIYSNDPIGVISNLAEYSENVKETNLGSAPTGNIHPFAQAAALPEAGSDLPFGDSTDEDPFKGM